MWRTPPDPICLTDLRAALDRRDPRPGAPFIQETHPDISISSRVAMLFDRVFTRAVR